MSTERPDESTQEPDDDETSFADEQTSRSLPAFGDGTGEPGADDRPIVIGGGEG